MKKYILILLSVVAVSLSSCKKETLITDPTNRTILFDIFPNDWAPSPDGRSFYKEISVPENNANFNLSGHVVVSMSFGDAVDVFEGLPEVYQGVTYRYLSGPGYVRVYVGNADGSTTVRPNYEVTAKITLIDAMLID